MGDLQMFSRLQLPTNLYMPFSIVVQRSANEDIIGLLFLYLVPKRLTKSITTPPPPPGGSFITSS